MVEFVPIQIVALGFPDLDKLKGDMLREIFRLSEAGIMIDSPKMNRNPAAITIAHREASALAPGGMEPQLHARVRQGAAHGHK
jgi:hypothetical protein